MATSCRAACQLGYRTDFILQLAAFARRRRRRPALPLRVAAESLQPKPDQADRGAHRVFEVGVACRGKVGLHLAQALGRDGAQDLGDISPAVWRHAHAEEAPVDDVAEGQQQLRLGEHGDCACAENTAGVAGRPEHLCPLAEAGRGWPRLEAALSLIWRWRGVPAGGAE